MNKKRKAETSGLVRKGRHVGRIVSGAVTFTLLGLLLAFGLAAANGGDSPEQDGAAAPAELVRELPGARTATSNTYLLSDGSRETLLSQTPVNYKDGEGHWRPIDEDLAPQADGSGLSNGANSFDLALPERMGEGPVRLDTGGEWVSSRLLGQDTDSAEVEGSLATYGDPGEGVSFQLTSAGLGVKETIELADASQPRIFRFKLDASAGVTPTLTDAGSVVYRKADGELVAITPAPTIEDSAPDARPSGAVRYELESDSSGGWTLTVAADPDWISAPERVWPVKIDPTTVTVNPSLDCEIYVYENSGGGSTNGGACSSATRYEDLPTFRREGANTLRARALLKFGLGAIPSNAAVTETSLSLFHLEAARPLPTAVQVRALTSSWEPSANWIKRDANKLGQQGYWTTPGGDFNSEGAELSSSAMGSKSQWWTFQGGMRDLVGKWVSGSTANNGVLVKVSDETACSSNCDRGQFNFINAGYSDPTYRPKLQVVWIPPAPADSKLTAPTDGTKTAKRFLLTAAWEHPGVTGVSFQYKTGEVWKDIPGSQVIDQGNNIVTWPVAVAKEDRESKSLYWDATSVTEGLAAKKLEIRAVLSGDPGASGYTKAVSAEIQRHTGGPKDAATGVGPGSVDLMTGNFTVSRTDVSIPAFNSTLEFSRSFSSREAGVEANGVLGPGWKPASPVEEAGGASWSKLVLKEETEVEEEGSTTFKWAELSYSEGGTLSFEQEGENFKAPDEMSGYVLARLNSSEIAFTDPEGNRTVFSNNGSGNEYLPISVAMTGGTGNKSRMIYEVVGSNRRLKKIIAPAAPGISCPDEASSEVDGCRLLTFKYGAIAGASSPTRLLSIGYWGPGEGSWNVAQYSYDSAGRLTAEWDPRISPALKETYTYNATGQIATLTPPGQEPWSMSYGTLPGGTTIGRLTSVKRATLVESNPTAQTTIAYEVPMTKGAGGPYDMNGAKVAEWGQQDMPTDATAVFPPDEVPGSPPSSWTRATVYYMDAEGQLVNVATPSGAGTTAPSITTTETDRFGNVSRELSAQNRLRALAQSTTEAKIAKSRELDTQFRYSKDGTELQEEIGPTHQVRLESGATTQARFYRSVQYDANFKYLNGTTTPSTGETKPHLPTSETTGALLATESVVDKQSTKYVYDWTLRKQIEVIADPEGSEESKSVTVYDPKTGLPTEMRQPGNAGGGGAGTTKFVYYSDDKPPAGGECENNSYAGLLCEVRPAAQPGTAGQPQLIVKKFLSYNHLDEPVEVTESPGGGSQNVRKTITGYDSAGRPKTSQLTGGGVAVPETETVYSSSLGLPTTQRIICPTTEPACDTQATSATFDSLGRLTSFLDADGVTAETTYDFLGRAATVDDGKGTQTMNYDSATGLLVELEDSAAGILTATYDADGNLVRRSLPNGLTAETIYDETGTPVALSYIKASSCGSTCNWLNFAVERSIRGKIMLEDGTLGKDEFAYDRQGRLITARETPAGGACTTDRTNMTRTRIEKNSPPVLA